MNTKILNIILENKNWVSLERSMRIYTNLCEVFSRGVDGDIVEMGSHHGGSAMLIQSAIEYKDQMYRDFHVFDSFKGFPPPTDQDLSSYKGGEFAVPSEVLVSNFKRNNLTLPTIHEGFFHETADQHPDKIAFAHLDSDLYMSIKQSLEIVFPRLSTGGVIVIDDYNHKKFPGVKQACLEFFAGRHFLEFEEQAVFTK